MRSAFQGIKSKLKRQVLVRNEQDQSFLGATAWKSLVNISEFFPGNSRFKKVIATFSENLAKWRSFFFSSLRDSYRDKPYVVPEMPDNLEKDISFLEIMILIKHIRPEELENFLRCSGEAVKKHWEKGESANETAKKFDPLEDFARGTEKVVIALHSGDELAVIEGIDFRSRRRQKKCFKIWIENDNEAKIEQGKKKVPNYFEGLEGGGRGGELVGGLGGGGEDGGDLVGVQGGGGQTGGVGGGRGLGQAWGGEEGQKGCKHDGGEGRWEEVHERILKTAHSGDWLIIRNFETIGEKESRILHRRISDVLRDQSTKPDFKIWILTKFEGMDSKPINIPSELQSITKTKQ